METVADIFTQAGWSAGQKDGWNGAFVWADQSVVGGIDPWGVPRVTVVGARSHEDAAAWLIEHAKQLRLEPLAPAPEAVETAAHEAHEEIGAEAVGAISASDGDELGSGDDVSVRLPARLEHVDALGTEGLDDVSDEDADDERAEPDLGAEILDADYSESIDLLVEGSDFADVAIEPDAPGAFIFGDNLHQMRTAAIGLVVQISLAKQDAIWAEAGAGPDEYAQLTGAVVRDTVDGLYRGDQATYDRFVALSQYDHAARNVQAAERERVKALTVASREEVEAFDPEADWP